MNTSGREVIAFLTHFDEKEIYIMPIIGDGDSAHVEYKIPDDIDGRIPDYFYTAMVGELCSIFGLRLFNKIDSYVDEFEHDVPLGDDSYYDLNSSSAGWYEAFKATCRKLDMMWLVEYHDTLKWYDADLFDGVIEERIINKFIESENHNRNDYYKYLTQLDD